MNVELLKKIKEIVGTNPYGIHQNIDEDLIVDKIVSSNTLRLKKHAIKYGVHEYFKSKLKINEEINDVEEMQKPKKKIKKTQFEFQFQDKMNYKFENMGAIDQIFIQIKNTIFDPIQRKGELTKLGIHVFKGYLLTGSVGVGKTLLANCILSYMRNTLKFNAYSVNAGSLISADAEQKIKKLFQTVKQNEPSVVLIDDIDIMCSKESSKRPQGSPTITLTLQIDKIRQNNIYLIATSSNHEKLDISLKKLNRFDKLIEINTNNDQSRLKIIKKLFMNVQHNLTSTQIIQLAKSTSGFMAADLVMLLKEAALHVLQQTKGSPIVLTSENLIKSLKFVQPILKKQGFTDIPSTTLEDVGGLKNLKVELQRQIIIPMREQDKFKLLNFDIQSGGVLLYGPPGCGKTMLAKAIANAVRANFIIVKGPELLNKYVGESEQAVREVFSRAQRASPCVIFFDEFDAIATKRSDQGNQVTERVVNTLLTALDGVEERKMVFVIAATNRKDMVDQAILRAGRIQKHLYVPQPTEIERVQILKAITKKMKINKAVEFIQIAKKTKGFSGADLKFLVKEATVTAVMENRNEVFQNDLNKALDDLLQSKQKNKLDEKVHEIELKDDEENQRYAYHYESQKNKNEVEVEKKIGTNNSASNLINQFMEFLSYKLNKQ